MEDSESEPTSNYGQLSILNHQNPEISNFYQKGFSQITNKITGMSIHAFWIKGLIQLSVFHVNTLVNLYSKFGCINQGRYLFDEMFERNEATWNTMIAGYVRVGLYDESFGLFGEMRSLGFEPSGFLIASLITACNRSNCMVYEGAQIHGFVLKFGVMSDVFVGTSILNFYGTYGSGYDALNFFEEMPDRNVVSWTSLMVSYSNNNDPGEVINVYRRMERENVSGNENTFSAVIRSCAALDDELLGRQILGHVYKTGFDSNVSVANSFISMFGSLKKMDEARYIFDRIIERDIITWNSMISANVQNGFCEEAFGTLYMMRRVHNEISSTTLSSLISVCNTVDTLKWGRGIQSLVFKMGFHLNVCVCNTLLTMYSVSGKSAEAEQLFNEMPSRDIISWNSLMCCYVQDKRFLNSLKLFATLIKMKLSINHVTFASALGSCSDSELLNEGKIVHALAILRGQHENLIVGNALITMYGKHGLMKEAHCVTLTMPKQDRITWNALIGSYAELEESNEATKAFKVMRKKDIYPNYITIVNVLGAFAAPKGLLIHGQPFHAYILLSGFGYDDYVKNSLITMYAKCGDLDSSNYIFQGLLNKNIVTWNAMVAANAHHGRGEEAIQLFVQMRKNGVKLDQFSFSGALSGSANLALLEEGQMIHSLVIKLGFLSDIHIINAAMDMYGKSGEMNDVLALLPEPSNRTRLSWNVLISSFSRHGHFQKARETFHDMLKQGPKPDHVTFVSLLSACNHGGLIDEGLTYYSSMLTEFGVTPAIEHCVCIIDLLGRSGKLAEAEKFIKEMPVPPNGHVWRSLLSSSKIHGNPELGKKSVENLFKLEPGDDSAYVLYSNMCATNGKWKDVEIVREKMGSNNVVKTPACSWVKLKNKLSTFGMGDKSHLQTKAIYAKLEEVMIMIRQAGYVADTSFALHDTDEEQKEHNLWNHSERLALAYSLINTPEGSTVRIFKNLRVCGDCHSVFKFVSRLVRRQIVLRDPYRFHHFTDGTCSCSDFW